ncbi:iron uptake transporter permease EfeU [Rhizobium sp. SYY.PMSO]|uniref:iron uptake transporter permease EfeU n=1 Tax=Rhizobium sp. SYY.PMSO TaxID=3382192 RepID=UPI000DE17A5C
MLATLIIGLREGLEASLIVGIIAAFLRKNGKSLSAMWLGVALAVLLSVAVGVGLELVEQALPQASQEGMECVIGAIAVFFVTGMIAWMNTHARGLKHDLEAEANEALSQGGAYALVGMAFLAVLREGFETSVFLLATFSAAQSAVLAAAGAIIGLALAVIIGWGIYIGGIRINLSRFFRFTGAFLVLVAAGLVISALRAAHEAGWLNAGQQSTVNLAWLVTPGTVRSALVTGVLGIPADPRLIEVLGWLAYLVPVALFIYWPASMRIEARMAARLRLVAAAALATLALGLATLYPTPHAQLPVEAPIVSSTSAQPIGAVRLKNGEGGSASVLKVAASGSADLNLSLPSEDARHELHDGTQTSAWTITDTNPPPHALSSLTLDQLVALSGGRIPVGFSPARHPGPFMAGWSVHRSVKVWVANGVLLDAARSGTTVVTLSGGGLQTSRTLAVRDTDNDISAGDWQVSASYRDKVAAARSALTAAKAERAFWAVQLPLALAVAAIVLAAFAGRTIARLRRRAEAPDCPNSNPGHGVGKSTVKGATHAAH